MPSPNINLSAGGDTIASAFTKVNNHFNAEVIRVAASGSGWTGADYVCDGTGDQVEINAAIAAADANGAVVELSHGTFNIADKITPASGVSVRGQGMGVTTLRAINSYTPTPGAVSGYQLVYGNTLSNVDFRDLTLDHNEASGTTNATYVPNSHCLDLRVITNLSLYRVEVLGAIRYSMYLDRSTNIHVEGCRILTGQGASGAQREQQDGIHLISPNRFRVIGNDVITAGPNNTGDDGIVVRSPESPDQISKNGTIAGNVISSDQSGIKIIGAGTANLENIAVTGNTVYDSYGGFVQIEGYATFSGKLKDISVTGNVGKNFLGSDTHVLAVMSANTVECFDNITISNNIIDGVANRAAFGYYVAHGKTLTMTGNTIKNAAVERGFHIGNTSKPVDDFTLCGNVIDMTGSHVDNNIGIVISRSRYGTISGNLIKGDQDATTDTQHGIYLTGDATNQVTDVAVSGNTLRNCQTGINEVSGGNVNYNKFVGNVVRSCTTGISMTGANSTTTG